MLALCAAVNFAFIKASPFRLNKSLEYRELEILLEIQKT